MKETIRRACLKFMGPYLFFPFLVSLACATLGPTMAESTAGIVLTVAFMGSILWFVIANSEEAQWMSSVDAVVITGSILLLDVLWYEIVVTPLNGGMGMGSNGRMVNGWSNRPIYITLAITSLPYAVLAFLQFTRKAANHSAEISL